MRIVFDHQIFAWQRYGGISRYYHETAKHLAAIAGQQVEIFAPMHVNEYIGTGGKAKVRGWKVSRTARMDRAARFLNHAASQLLLRPRRDVDIFHETYFGADDHCPRSARRVITVYDMIHEKYADILPAHDRTRELKAHAVRRADHVICISRNTQRDLMEILGVPEQRTSVVHLGCSLALKPAANEISGSEGPYILFVGERFAYKNFRGLLQAYAGSHLLRDGFRLVCFGGGAFSAEERQWLASLGLAPEAVTQVSGEDEVLSGLYASAAVFVYPSLYEGFGMPPLEAMALGCPVACSNASSLPEVVGDAAELFDPTDLEQMRAAIERVVSSTTLAAALVARGHEQRKRFSWESCAGDTLEVYQRLLGRD